ncbi:hypothetical protein SAMN04244579_04855, partial [Azotobacter beijerinckii]
MAVLTAQLARPTQGGIENPQLSAALDAFAWVEIPGESDTWRSPGGSTLSTPWPVEANGRSLAGQRQRAFVDDWYDRIHISPAQLDLGNVVSTQTSTVSLWNAYREPRTLLGVAGLDEGIELSGQLAAPLTFTALQERIWQVGVTPDGAPVLDTALAWTFDNGATASLRLTANRIVAWAFAP